MIDIFNKSPRFAVSMSPIFVVLVAFCFSMTVGVLWEFFEYISDLVFHTNMQKDTIFPDGYVDIGLIDTMEDLTVNFLGAVIFCVFGYFYVKHDGRSKLLPHILLTRNAAVPLEEQSDCGVVAVALDGVGTAEPAGFIGGSAENSVSAAVDGVGIAVEVIAVSVAEATAVGVPAKTTADSGNSRKAR
jgi:hypothetical protein